MIKQVEKILQKIKALREAKNLTYTDMLSDVSVKYPNAYSKIERSKNITVLRLLEISQALDVNIATWFEDLDQNPLAMKEDREKLELDEKKDVNDIYLLIYELKREILLLKKEIAAIKPVVKKRKPSTKS